MATVPDAPSIFIRPKATDGTLEFYWQPGNSNGSDILSYTLDDGTTQTVLDSNLRYYKETGLTNKTDYSYTLLATNGEGAGPAAPFRTVQPGLKPEQPNFVSLYRLSETYARLSWFNQSADNADPNIPTPWRNVIVAPQVSNGKYPYPGDDSVTASAKSLYGYDTSGNILVAVDASYNFIVRSQNDPGYSLSGSGTGAFSLKDVNYSGDVFFNSLAVTNFNNRANFIVKKNTVSQPLNVDQPASIYDAGSFYYPNERGSIVIARKNNGEDNVKIISKNGFVKYAAPALSLYSYNFTRTNPVVPICPQQNLDDATKYTVQVYDYNTNTSFSSNITSGVGNLSISAYKNNLDTNAYFALNESGVGYRHYTISSNSLVPGLRFTGGSFFQTQNLINKELFITSFTLNNAKLHSILYIPNSGSTVLYDISGLNITSIPESRIYPLSSKKLTLYGTTASDSNIYTFDFNGTPSYTKRIVTNIGAYTFTSNSFSNFYKGYTNSAVSFIDLSNSTYYAISPLSSTPALQFQGTTPSIQAYSSNSQFTGTIYTNETNNWFFTGVGLNGGANTKELKYGPFGGPYNNTSLTSFTLQYLMHSPHYNLYFFYGGPGNVNRVYTLVKYNSGTNQFDVSGVDLSGTVLNGTAYSDNSGVNFVSVDTTNKSYKYSTTLWPPVEITPFMSHYYGTYPINNKIIAMEYGAYIYHIYNGSTFDSSGNLGVSNKEPIAVGPDCWYFIQHVGGASVKLVRISDTGTKVEQTFIFSTNNSTVIPKASATGFVCAVSDGVSEHALFDYNITRNTFNMTLFNSASNSLIDLTATYSTYLPNIEAV